MAQIHAAVLFELGAHGIHAVAQLAARENEVEVDENVIIPQNVAAEARRLAREGVEDAVDLLLLFRFELLELVVGLHHAHRLDEDRRAARGRVVHEARQLAAALGLHRHDEAPAALRDQRVLQNVPVARGRNDALQDLAALGRRRALVAANFRELGRGRVGDLVFVEDRGRDLLLQKAVRVQGEEELVDDRPLLVLLIIILHAAHIREKPRDVEKLPRVEHAAALGARERFAHVAHAAKGRAAAQHDHLARRVRLVEQAVDLAEIIRWRQPSRPRLGLRAHRVMLEHLQ